MMMYNNKMKGMDIPTQKITMKDVMDVAGAMGTLLILCPATLLGVQMLTRIL